MALAQALQCYKTLLQATCHINAEWLASLQWHSSTTRKVWWWLLNCMALSWAVKTIPSPMLASFTCCVLPPFLSGRFLLFPSRPTSNVTFSTKFPVLPGTVSTLHLTLWWHSPYWMLIMCWCAVSRTINSLERQTMMASVLLHTEGLTWIAWLGVYSLSAQTSLANGWGITMKHEHGPEENKTS